MELKHYPENDGFSNRNLLFQGSIFTGYVSFREGTGYPNKTESKKLRVEKMLYYSIYFRMFIQAYAEYKVSKKSHSQADTITLRLQKGSLRNNTIQYLFQAASCVHFVNLPKSTKKTPPPSPPPGYSCQNQLFGGFPQSSALEGVVPRRNKSIHRVP